MVSGSEPDARDAEFAHLSGPELVARLSTTYRRADYEAVARVLSARDRRVAEAEAALADMDALREKYDALLRRPRDEAEETAHLVGIAAPSPSPSLAHWGEPSIEVAEEGEVKGVEIIDLCSDDDEGEGAEGPRGDVSGVPCKKKRTRRRGRRRKMGRRGPASCADADADADADEDEDEDEDEEDGEDTEPLSQRWKRLRQGQPGATESRKGDEQGQSNSVGSLWNDPQKSSSARAGGPESRTGQMVGTPEDSKVAAFVQGRGVVEPEKADGEMPRTVLLSPGFVVRGAPQKGSSKSDHGGAGIAKKEGPSAGRREATPSQAISTSLTVKKCGESVKTNDETHEACTGSLLVGVGTMVVRAIREQEGGNDGVYKAKLLQQTSGIREQGGNLNSLETGKVGRSNQRDGELQKKLVNPKPNNLLKSSLRRVEEDARIAEEEGSSAGPGDATSSQARSTSLTVKECGESVKTNDETHLACTGSALVGVGTMVVGAIREQEGGNGGVYKAKVRPETCGVREQGENFDSLETGKAGESNQGDRELQKKLVNPKSNNLLKSSLRDEEDARMAEKGGFSMQSYVLTLSKVDSVSPKVTKNLAKGNSEMCSAPDGSPGAGARNGVPARGVSQTPKGNGQMNKTSMVESSSKCENKKVGADMQKCSPLLRQSEEGRIAREGVPFEETRTVSFPPLNIRNLSGPELRGYSPGFFYRHQNTKASGFGEGS